MSGDKGKILRDIQSNKLRGARFAFAGMNFMIDPADLPIEEGQCVDICNCDIDYKNNVSRRPGFQRIFIGNVQNAWANSDYVYCTIGNTLSYLIITGTTSQAYAIPGVPALYGIVEFKQVNNVVVFSDGLTMGILQGAEATIIPASVFDL